MKRAGKGPGLFESPAGNEPDREAPLAARMRPRSFDEFTGQQHIIGKGRVLRSSIEADQLPSIIFWGPPGSGKTTLANIIARVTRSHFSPISAVAAGVADLRRIVQEARERRRTGQRTILFIDEIHRFNKAQQDAVLPYVEDGTITLIGATTENPSFEVIGPLLSRCRVFALRALSAEEVGLIVNQALADQDRGLGEMNIELAEKALDFLIIMSNGDARVALNALEMAGSATFPSSDGKRHVGLSEIEDALQ
ncbi:MAG: AAA family ATPase, partial [Dehalococcoidia bacterium]|nr:AAA family ATPase [Dehalococcoidia bacterium]